MVISRTFTRIVSANSFVHHVNHFKFRKFFLDGIKPCGNGLLGILDTLAIKPARILTTPHQSVELEVTSIFLGPVISSFTTIKIITALSSFNRSPLTFVFSRNLVPVGTEIRTNLTVSRNVPDELSRIFGHTDAEREARRRKG